MKSVLQIRISMECHFHCCNVGVGVVVVHDGVVPIPDATYRPRVADCDSLQ